MVAPCQTDFHLSLSWLFVEYLCTFLHQKWTIVTFSYMSPAPAGTMTVSFTLKLD